MFGPNNSIKKTLQFKVALLLILSSLQHHNPSILSFSSSTSSSIQCIYAFQTFSRRVQHSLPLPPSPPSSSSSFLRRSSSTSLFVSRIRSSAGDLNTAYEWLQRQRKSPVSTAITWVDPLEETIRPPPSNVKPIGFDVESFLLDHNKKDNHKNHVDDADNVTIIVADSNETTNNNNNDKHKKEKVENHTSQEHNQTHKRVTIETGTTLRLPIYPCSAVHVPSSAFQKLHNVEAKNIKMSIDLNAGKWNIDEIIFENNEQITENTGNNGHPSSSSSANSNMNNKEKKRKQNGYFVLTLRAHDTHRIATVGTLMQVSSIKETYSHDKQTLLRMEVECQAKGIVHINGVERTIQNGIVLEDDSNDYWIGHVKVLEYMAGSDNTNIIKDNAGQKQRIKETQPIFCKETVQSIVRDYAKVRNMYVHHNGVASRELPLFARNAVQANLPTFTQEDFLDKVEFWNVVECWLLLCNTVREERRSKLQMDMNELMVEAASKKRGPLKLPIKRDELPDDVQATLNRMEQKASEDYISCGMDPCLDFQALLGMGMLYNQSDEEDIDRSIKRVDQVHHARILFLGNMIKREKSRLDTKDKLKDMFEEDDQPIDGINDEFGNDDVFE